MSYPPLVTNNYVTSALTEISLTTGQLAFLSTAIINVSDAIRRYLGDRILTRTTLTKEFIPAQDGLVALDQLPVNKVTRVAGNRSTLFTIGAYQNSCTDAAVYFSSTGDYATGITYTGLTLDWTANGTEQTQTLLFATYPTISPLAAAVQAVGPFGLTTQPTPQYQTWPSARLVGLETAQGALDDGACCDAYTETLSGCQVDQETGMLRLNYSSTAAVNSPAWGPDWYLFADDVSPSSFGKVQVTYDSGFDTIPNDIQEAVVEGVSYMLSRLKSDPMLRRERAGKYDYETFDLIKGLAPATLMTLSQYRIVRA